VEPITSYIDYRRFLKDLYEEKKKTTRHFSYRYFSKVSGINSPVFLKSVIEGKRNLTARTIQKFIKGLSLSKRDAEYFRYLVLFNQATTQQEKQEQYQKLRAMAEMVVEKTLETHQFDYYKNWYTSVIRELICMYDFKGDYEELARCVYPNILPAQAMEAVELLLKLGLIKRNKKGIFRQTHKAITSGSEIVSMAVRQFNEHMLELAKNALRNMVISRRNIAGLTVGVSRETYNVMVAEINAFLDRMVNIVNADKDQNNVYQLNVQLFPLSNEVPVTKK
jgi:uncharacterized protein (TIGR02147 family)